jgi:hypothetical protein
VVAVQNCLWAAVVFPCVVVLVALAVALAAPEADLALCSRKKQELCLISLPKMLAMF